jgi:hypothetical protein
VTATADGNAPATRSLEELIRACAVVADEAAFQAMRLKEHVNPRTESEAEHHAALREQYLEAEMTVRRLGKYHQKRLERLRERGTLDQASFDQPGAITDGKANAFIDDSEAPV